jgi:hypothetical protein
VRAPVVLAALALALPAACFGGAELSASGKGLPVVTVDFPARARPGSVGTASVHVTNPGPGAIGRVTVAFARVGAPSAQGLPEPIVGGSPAAGVVAVRPRPSSVSADGAVYRFGPLAEGASRIIEFDLRVPRGGGVFANSVTVYDDAEPDRAGGARLETRVER